MTDPTHGHSDQGAASTLLIARDITARVPGRTLFSGLSFAISPGLSFVTGGDGSGKTTLLQMIAGTRGPDDGVIERRVRAICSVDPRDSAADSMSGRQWLDEWRSRHPSWDPGLEEMLIAGFALDQHVHKQLHMLSTGSRRKLGWVVVFACGAELSLLDMPFAALDAPARALLLDLLGEAAIHPRRAWVVADYEIPAALGAVPLSAHVDLGA